MESNTRNTAREWRRALARQNALANEISAACASGRVPDRRLVADWSLASMRVFAREKNLRPRECGAPLGERERADLFPSSLHAQPARRTTRPRIRRLSKTNQTTEP